MNWFTRVKGPLGKLTGKREIPQGVWSKCSDCKQIVYNDELVAELYVCPRCSSHKTMSARARIKSLIDEGTFLEADANMASVDPLKFRDAKRYKDRLAAASKSLGMKDALISGSGAIESIEVEIAAMEFKFQGGSMGSVVGEKLTRVFERAIKARRPALTISCSGGARMQEGIFSLMQMAKTASAVARLNESSLPYISVLSNPTTGGVTASFAMLGDVIIAEPGALIGFAGRRVIEQTIRERLPERFQRAEFLLEHGFIDMIVHRHQLKSQIARVLRYALSGASEGRELPDASRCSTEV